MRVLYVDHTSLVSGAGRSLLELLRALPPRVEPALACPDGPLADAVRELGVDRLRLPGTSGSLKLHPLHTTRAGWELAASAAAVRRHARGVSASVVHANSLRAGLSAAAAGRLGAPRPVVHVRDCLPPARVARTVQRLIAHEAAAVIAISDYTARCFGHPAHVVANAVDASRFDPAQIDRAAARAALDVPADAPLLGVLAQITPWKAQDDAIRILGGVRERHPQARLVIAGEAKFVSRATRFDNVTYQRGLHELTAQLGLSDAVLFAGERPAPEVLRALDLLLVPSWEEPFGRTVIEGMAMEVPVIATAVGGPREILEEGEDGVLLEPRRPELWAARAAELLADDEWRRRMGAAGRRKAMERYSPAAHAAAVLSVYEAIA